VSGGPWTNAAEINVLGTLLPPGFVPLAITTATLPIGIINTGYQASLVATGGVSSLTWSLASGLLPAGLAFSSSGTISGTPTETGSFVLTAQVTDSILLTQTRSITLRIVEPLIVTTTSLAAATVSSPYQQPLAASGGSAAYTWSVMAGSYLPAGLTLSSSGVLSGTPTQAGTFFFTVQVTDSLMLTTSRTLSLAVGGSAGSFEYVLGDTHYPYSTQPQPAGKGASFVDSTYHLPVTRITTTNADRNSYGTITEYPTFDPSSADGQFIIFQGCASLQAYENAGCGGYLLYNLQTYQFIRSLSSSLMDPLLGWDGQEPDVRWNRGIYNQHAFVYRKHMQLREYDVDTQADMLLHDFSADFPTLTPASDSSYGYYVYCHEYCSPSEDSRYYSFYIQNSGAPYDRQYAFVYDRLLDKVVGTKYIANAPDGMQGVHMSPSGNYIIVNYFCASGHTTLEMCGPTAYTRDFSSWVKVSNFPDHMGYVWTKQGHEAVFMISSGTDQAEFTRLDTGQTYQVYSARAMDYPAILYSYQHNPGWMMAGTYGGSFDHSVWSNESNAGPGQIFAFEVDETKCSAWYDSYDNAHGAVNPHSCPASNQRIWRIAFTQNLYTCQQPCSRYFMQVNPQVNFDGTKIWFGSNWRNTENPPEVYQVDLPPNWWTDLANLP
jgi:hypothetical protein